MNTNKEHGFFVPKSSFVWYISSASFLASIVFMGGYFWGKRTALVEFCSHAERESLSDHIYGALCASDYKETSATESDLDEVVDEQESVVSLENPLVQTEQGALSEYAAPEIEKQPEQPKNKDSAHRKFYAELIGFGTLQGAQRFASRLEKKQMPVVINKRVSKTAKGRVVHWYQVVTAEYQHEDDLIALVNTIKQQERLNDVRIVTNMDRY